MSPSSIESALLCLARQERTRGSAAKSAWQARETVRSSTTSQPESYMQAVKVALYNPIYKYVGEVEIAGDDQSPRTTNTNRLIKATHGSAQQHGIQCVVRRVSSLIDIVTGRILHLLGRPHILNYQVSHLVVLKTLQNGNCNYADALFTTQQDKRGDASTRHYLFVMWAPPEREHESRVNKKLKSVQAPCATIVNGL
nr:hypothetical protein CFP56_11953 [Quercus suber]